MLVCKVGKDGSAVGPLGSAPVLRDETEHCPASADHPSSWVGSSIRLCRKRPPQCLGFVGWISFFVKFVLFLILLFPFAYVFYYALAIIFRIS